MITLCGYNFCSDGNCLDATPIQINNITQTVLTNGIFSHFNVTGDVTSPYDPNPPTTWDYLTLMDANFNGNINAGNVDYSLSTLSGIKIKRRKIGDFNWVTLKYIPITQIEHLSFVFNDYLASSLQEYEYAFVPIINEVEGDYIVNKITTSFNGVFICDLNTIYKFYAGVKYGSTEQVQKIGVFEPFGRQYPIVVSNSLINYQKSQVSGTILPNDFMATGKINRLDTAKERKDLLDFLTNKKAKILKDLKLCV